MSNMDIYNAVRSVPEDAKKRITGGRLNGKTDINPMWRIKVLTERFGPCGIGWKYVITDKCHAVGRENEIAAFVDILLYVKHGDAWSDGIPGTGGSMFVELEKSGPHVNDECYKMALTDAISVACKALGIGADVYWEADATKYGKSGNETRENPVAKPTQQPDWVDRAKAANLNPVITAAQKAALIALCGDNTAALTEIRQNMGYAKTSDIRKEDYTEVERRLKAALGGQA